MTNSNKINSACNEKSMNENAKIIISKMRTLMDCFIDDIKEMTRFFRNLVRLQWALVVYRTV